MKRWLLLVLCGLPSFVMAAPPAVSLQAASELRPYDAEDYRLAFDALLGVGDHANALRIAQQAVKHEPANLDWRTRLARVAEWLGKTELAWEQREYLYRHGQRNEETIGALLRLGVLYGEPQMMLDLWLGEARRKALTLAQWEEIRSLYEKTLRPEEAMRFFEHQYRQQGEARFLEWAAAFAESAGKDEEALRLHRERAALEPFSPAAVLAATTFLVRHDRLREAYQLLEQNSPRVPDDERAYWKTLGDVAWELVETGAAERAYRRYLGQDATDQGLMSRLIYLVQQRNPQEAASLYLAAYRRQGGSANVIAAMQLLSDGQDLARMAQVLAAIRPEDLPALESDARFLLLRALFHQRRMQLDPAWQDLQRAQALAPQDGDVAINAIWLMIERRDDITLEAFLRRWQARAADTPAFWLPFAAAYHALDRYREALPWYQREITRTPQDVLLLLNYADLVERLEQPGMALRIRQHAWQMLKAKPRPELDRLVLTGEDLLLAQTRLMLLDRPGDGAMRLAQQIVNRIRELPDGQCAHPQVEDLILAWAIGSEQYQNAKLWMWRNQLEQASHHPPVWGEAQTALQLQLTETMQHLLADKAGALPIYNRYDIAHALEDRQQALDIAFHGMERNPVDEALYDRYRLHAPLESNFFQLDWRSERLGDYRAAPLETMLHLRLTDRLALDLTAARTPQSSREPQLDHLAPARDRLLGIEAQWRGARGTTRFALFRRDELDRNTGWRLGQEWHWGRRLSLEGALERQAEATDSLPLRVAGEQSGLRLGLIYTLAKRETLNLGLRYASFATQFGDRLGSGLSYDIGFTHRLRTEYPDWRLRVYFSAAHYRYGSGLGTRSLAALAPAIQSAIAAGTQDAVRYFLPESSQTFGLCFGMGENLAGQDLRNVYSRGWRHHYELCATRNDASGAGYSAAFGLVGSLTGEDHLSLSLGQSAGGTGNQGINRHLQLRYRHYF